MEFIPKRFGNDSFMLLDLYTELCWIVSISCIDGNCIIQDGAILTHDEHIFVRPKKVCLL